MPRVWSFPAIAFPEGQRVTCRYAARGLVAAPRHCLHRQPLAAGLDHDNRVQRVNLAASYFNGTAMRRTAQYLQDIS